MQPDLLKLKPLKNLKEVHKTYNDHFEKYKSRKYWKYLPCPICKNVKKAGLIPIDHFGYSRCLFCNSVYAVRQHIKSLDYNIYRDKLVKPSEKIREKLCEKKFEYIDAYLPSPGNLLDVGCGTGTLMRVFQKHGWEVVGLEPDITDIDIIKSTLEHFWTTDKFDCITFFGVLEHVNNPLKLLKRAKSFLKRDGMIVFEVPSADSFLMEYIIKYPFSPYRFIEHGRHLSFFSEDALDYLCHKSKLKIIDMQTVGFDLQTILLKSCKEILQMQDILNTNLQGDHYRVYVKQ